jgi:type IV pilus assembly protein PilW
LTLIEMAIAMTIAMFLLVGVVTIVMSTRTAFGTQSQLAQLQDNERLAMTVMTDQIQAAGYYPGPISNTASGVLPTSTAFATAGQAITGTFAAAAPGDTVTVRYATVGTDGLINCAGATNTNPVASAPVAYENQFSVTPGGTLQCVPSVNGAAGAVVPLVTGLQKMVILYGVKTGSLSQTCTDSYMTATEVAALAGPVNGLPNAWFNICSVKVSLFFVNPIAGAPVIRFTRVIAVMATAGANT